MHACMQRDLVVSWEVPSRRKGDAPVAGYSLMVVGGRGVITLPQSEGGPSEATEIVGKSVLKEGISSCAETVSGLLPGRTYFVRVRADDCLVSV